MKTIRLLSTLCLLLSAVVARADLQVTITPGYVFGSSERADTTKLNRLGAPTATITGTVGGTNASLGAASVNSTHLADSVVDGSNVVFRVSPRAIAIDTTVFAGLGLSAPSAGAPIRVNVDTNYVTITNDVVTINLANLTNFVSVLASNAVNLMLTNVLATYTNQLTQLAGGNFTGVGVDGAVTVNSGKNVASVTRNGSGRYDVLFTSALSTTNYSVVATSSGTASANGVVVFAHRATAGFTLYCASAVGSTPNATDAHHVSFLVY